jgi:hypothetical protein
LEQLNVVYEDERPTVTIIKNSKGMEVDHTLWLLGVHAKLILASRRCFQEGPKVGKFEAKEA